MKGYDRYACTACSCEDFGKKYFDAGHVSIVFREPLDVAVLVHEIIYLQEIRNVLKRFSNVRVEFEEKPDAIGKPYMYP